MSRRRLAVLHDGAHLPVELWERFTAKAQGNGYTPGPAIARLIRRYVTHGFDDGAPEQNPTPPAFDSQPPKPI